MVVRAERLLFITTSVSNLGDGKPTDTGLWYAGHPSAFPECERHLHAGEVVVCQKQQVADACGMEVSMPSLTIVAGLGGSWMHLASMQGASCPTCRGRSVFAMQAAEPGRALLSVSEKGVHH